MYLLVKRLIIAILWVGVPAGAQTLATPVISLATAIYSAGAFTSIGSNPTYPRAVGIQLIPSNLAAWQGGATAQTVCYRLDGGTPTATVAGTCDPPATTYVAFPVSAGTPYNTINITGKVTVTAIGTAAGFTNSAQVTSTITIQPFQPAPALSGTTLGAYSYSPLVVTLVGNQGSNLIYTTDASTPTASGTCTATNGTAAANGATITLPNSAQTTVKFIPCVGGVSGSVQTGVYTQQAAQTWYVRPGGGSRWDPAVTSGLCNGKFDADYPGSGVNQNCAFNDVRYLWMNGVFGNSTWVIAGGDTVVIRGCTALSTQGNPSNPNCRIGQDNATNTNIFCQGISQFWGCSMQPPPSGSTSQNTKLLGGCAFGTYTCTAINTSYPYATTNETQLFSGFNAGSVIWLNGSTNITIEGLELTTHNGACSTLGGPRYPAGCNTGSPASDFGRWGIITDETSGNVTLQDVYIHGFSNLGMGGPIGGTMTLTRVFMGFNAFAGWNFDDGNADPDLSGSSIVQSQVTMIGNGCEEQYPIVNTSYPALACWDSVSGGFGDSWSGQASLLSSFTCDHCSIQYNTKDGAIGPHTLLLNLSVTNTIWQGNMGAQWKWGMQQNSTTVFTNDLVNGNCQALGAQIPGAAQNFSIGTGLGGSYLSNYCRAGPVLGAYFADANSSVTFNNNDFITYANTVLELGCGTVGACTGSASYNWINNITLGYTVATGYIPGGNGSPPGQFFFDTAVSMNCSNSLGFGIRNITPCNTTTIANLDPLFVSEPAQGSIPPESSLYNFNFNLQATSPAPNNGTTPCPSTDFFGHAQTSPCTIGAVVFSAGVASPTELKGNVVLKSVKLQ